MTTDAPTPFNPTHHPYFNLANHELMVDRIVEEFAWASVSREEAETAVKAAYAEDKVFKHDVQQEGLKALAYMKEHDCRGIVLAGRPYHIDPEINHGIPETICSLGMVVLASMIGARGLGEYVLQAIQTLNIGQGVEAGAAIVILAIIIDRITQAYGRRSGKAV